MESAIPQDKDYTAESSENATEISVVVSSSSSSSSTRASIETEDHDELDPHEGSGDDPPDPEPSANKVNIFVIKPQNDKTFKLYPYCSPT